MTSNKPEVVALVDVLRGHGGRYVTLRSGVDHLSLIDGEALIRLSDYETLQAECDALRDKIILSLGVGDGAGNLFVHGDYDSIKRVQELIFECEKLRRGVSELVGALESAYHLIANHSGETLPTSYASDQMDMINAALAAHRKGGE